jgi:hypothetical protein
MKKFILQIIFILLIGSGSSFAGNLLFFHVGSSGSGSSGPPGVCGTLDLTAGCPLPMLGVF